MKNLWFIGRLSGYLTLTAHIFLIVALLLAPAYRCYANIDQPSGIATKDEPKSFSLKEQTQAPVRLSPLSEVDIKRLLTEDLAREKDTLHPAPYRFAVTENAVYTLENSGIWQDLEDGRLWLLRIQAAGAKSLNLGISHFDMPDGAKLWLSNPKHSQFEGPYTNYHRSPDGSLWTSSIEGDELIAEVFVPTGIKQPVLEVGEVNRGMKQTGSMGNSSWCERDVVCPEGNAWNNQIRAVARLTIEGQNESCSGTLLNNTGFRDPQHFHKLYFLTALHCKEIPNFDPDKVEITWDFQSGSCRPNTSTRPAAPETGQRILTGAYIRAEWPATDVMLLELKNPPPASVHPYYAGWDPNDATIPTGAVGIHHPKGDVKAISTSHNVCKIGYPDPVCSTGDKAYWLTRWDAPPEAGVTETGSSGSCLFESTNKRCIGQVRDKLEERCANTNRATYYGRLSKSWNGGCPMPRPNGPVAPGTECTQGLRDWLDPKNTNPPSGIDGDPHITTADGVHYNFQGAGEYVTLRQADGMEIQTRQAPIATTFAPGADPYDGVATCVSLNTAVAARVGNHRVSYQPNISDKPDSKDLQLYIDKKPVALKPNATIDLEGGGRITKTSANGDLNIEFPNGSVLFVIPGWWESQQKWYLNVDVVPPLPVIDGIEGDLEVDDGTEEYATIRKTDIGTPSSMGLMGGIARGSWLPALPNGSSLGPMPDSLHQRYIDLYQTFGHAWRVTDDTSLFHYAPGTSTATFTFDDWPRENPSTPESCSIPGAPVATPVKLNIAADYCSRIVDKNRKADCIFDVMVTGHAGFADAYLRTEQFHPGATAITVKDDKDPSEHEENVTFTATVTRADAGDATVPAGKVQFILDGSKVGEPVQIDSKGQATWSTSTLSIGTHQITANFLIQNPGNIGILSSISADESHKVTEKVPPYIWLLILLIVLLILAIWWYRRGR